MTRSRARHLRAVAALSLALGAAPATFAESGSEPSPDLGSYLTDERSAIGLGLGVSPLRWSLAPATAPGARAGESARLLDPDSRGSVVSFDLTLRWPGHDTTSLVEPYVMLGPALFVVEPDLAGRLLGTRVDPALQLGAKAGAGVTWRLGKNTTLFGAYEVTTAGPDGLASPAGRAPADAAVGGYDFTYGLRLRY